MSDIFVRKLNEVFVRVECDKSILYELAEHFEFYAPNYRYDPRYKNKMWSGKLKLLNLSTRQLYYGLHSRLASVAKTLGYTIEYSEEFYTPSTITFNNKEIEDCKHTIRDYQESAVEFALERKRCILLSPTASGKSFLLYTILKHLKKKTLLIVPRVDLVEQMANDFIDYNPKSESWIYRITAGVDKNPKKDFPIYVATWQSLANTPKEWFNQFECVIVDECHLAAARILTGIMEKCENIEWRIGCTGTISNEDSKVNALVLEGLFGEIFTVSTVKELTQEGFLTKLDIRALILKYDKITARGVRVMKYKEEIDFFYANKKRNNFIVNLALSQTNNTLVLFSFIDTHGKVLYDLAKKKAPADKNVHFVVGDVKGNKREEIRQIVNSSNNNIIFANYSIYSTGTNIPELHTIIFASGYKSKIKVLQSIGRGLRLADNKERCVLFDIVDDCSARVKKNYSVQHFLKRLALYQGEEHEVKIINIDFK